MNLDSQELIRYDRHLRLKNVGMTGQTELKQARVLLVGLGGLGCPAAQYLVAAGVGKLGIIDFDDISVSNLQRQILFRTDEVGKSKVLQGQKTLNALNPHVTIKTYNEAFNAESAATIIKDYDIVVDAVDNFATRYLINDACVLAKKINVHGSVQGFEGRVSVFCSENGPCYRCMFPKIPEKSSVPSCSESGVLGIIPGTIGTIMATETIKLIVGIGKPLIGRLMIVDALEPRTDIFKIGRDSNCRICGNSPTIKNLNDHNQKINKKEFCEMNDSQKTINCAELAKLINDGMKNHVIIDVRNQDESEQIPIIPGASLIPLPQLESRISEIDKSKSIIVNCHAGKRGEMALSLLEKNGLKNVKNLMGGITAWQLHQEI